MQPAEQTNTEGQNAAPAAPATAGPAPAPDTINGRKYATITLEEAVQRGTEQIKIVHLLRPRAGDLRGLMIANLLQMEAGAITQLLPRITSPTLLKHEVDNLDPADLIAFAMEVANFLVPKSAMAQFHQSMTP